MSRAQGFCLWILQITALFGILIFFLWLVLRPSDPAFSVTDVTVSGNNVTFGLEVSNGNNGGRASFYYTNVTLYSGDVYVGSTTVPPFDLRHGKTVSWKRSVPLNRSRDLKVAVATYVRYRILTWKSRRQQVSLQGAVPTNPGGGISSNGRKTKLRPAHKKWRFSI